MFGANAKFYLWRKRSKVCGANEIFFWRKWNTNWRKSNALRMTCSPVKNITPSVTSLCGVYNYVGLDMMLEYSGYILNKRNVSMGHRCPRDDNRKLGSYRSENRLGRMGYHIKVSYQVSSHSLIRFLRKAWWKFVRKDGRTFGQTWVKHNAPNESLRGS